MMMQCEETNEVLETYLESLVPLLEQRNLVGYVAARNYRKIGDEIREYLQIKSELFIKYGEECLDEDGNFSGSYSIDPTSSDYETFRHALSEISSVRQNIQILTISPNDCIGILSGNEFLALDWMIEDGD